MPKRLRIFLVLALAMPVTGCKHVAVAPTAASVTIMTFNVENLFDNADDPGKDDRTYLPLAAKRNAEHIAACGNIDVDRWRDQCLNWDWSDALIERKLDVIAQSILQVNNGRGPDIVALQEIENIAILDRLRTEYLQPAGYATPVLIEGTDLRGIDVAFLSRLPIKGGPVLHPLSFGAEFADREADTRGILETTFELPDGSLLTGYAVHFPAPFHPTAMRVAAYQRLNELREALPEDRPVFAAGDFNTTSAEDRAKDLLGRLVRDRWTIAHELGCGSDCKGSAYYARDDSWSFLDMILWSPAKRGAGATWDIRADSVRLANEAPGQRHADGTPARFDATGGAGVSDHWPVVMTLESD